MKVVVPHHTTPAEARRIVEDRAGTLMQKIAPHAQNVEQEWIGDTFHFRGKALGLQVKGIVEVTATDVIVETDLPLLAKPMEPRIRETVEREAAQMFRKA